jgi:hypothetical protein
MVDNLAREYADDRVEMVDAKETDGNSDHGKIIVLYPEVIKIVNCAKCVGECKVF